MGYLVFGTLLNRPSRPLVSCMKKFSTVVFLTLALCCLTVATASAQQFNRRKLYNTVSVHLNAMNYFGDLVPRTSFTSFRLGATRPNLGVTYMHRFSPRLSGRAGLSWGRISGNDRLGTDRTENDASYRYYRGLSFRNDLVELSGVAIIDLFENRGTYLKRREFAPYVFIGLAGFYHNPKANTRQDGSGDWVALQPLRTEGQSSGYSRLQVAVPFGAGIRYKLDRQYDIGFEIGWRKTFTDYLDDVSAKYVDPTDLGARISPDYNKNLPEGPNNLKYIHSERSKFADRSNENSDGVADGTAANPGTIHRLTPQEQLKYSGYGTAGSKRGTDN
jgi:hypothetical protein